MGKLTEFSEPPNLQGVRLNVLNSLSVANIYQVGLLNSMNSEKCLITNISCVGCQFHYLFEFVHIFLLSKYSFKKTHYSPLFSRLYFKEFSPRSFLNLF